jgi:hypothetical protein
MFGFLAMLSAWMAQPAHALITRYVNAATGNDLNAGTSPGAAWRTIGKANTDPSCDGSTDDVLILIAPGLYTDTPGPAITAGNAYRYFYVGSLSVPTAVKIQPSGDAQITTSRVSIKGVNFLKSVRFKHKARVDSITTCRIDQSLSIGASDSIVIDNTIGLGPYLQVGPAGNLGIEDSPFWADSTTNTRISNCSFPNLSSSTAKTFQTDGNHSRSVVNFIMEDSDLHMTGLPPEGGGWYLNATTGFYPRRNFWRMTNHKDQGTGPSNMIRNQSNVFTFTRDTIIVDGPVKALNSIFHIGSQGLDSVGAAHTFTFDSCYVFNLNGSPFQLRSNPVKGLRMRYSTFVGAEWSPFDNQTETPLIDSLVIWHCTIAGKQISEWHGVVPFDKMDPDRPGSKILFKDNIVYDFGAGGVLPCSDPTHSGIALHSGLKGSGPCPSATCRTDMNNNLYFEAMQSCSDTACAGSRSITVLDAGICSRPGASNATNTNGRGFEFAWPGRDSLSYWGSPVFKSEASTALGDRDSLFGLNASGFPRFNPAIAFNSLARGRASDGSDIGAVQFADYASAVLLSDKLVGQADVGAAAVMTLSIRNEGTDSLRITITNPTSTHYSATSGPSPAAIGPNNTMQFTFTVTSFEGAPTSGTYVLATNDPKQPTIYIPFTLTCASENCAALPEEF